MTLSGVWRARASCCGGTRSRRRCQRGSSRRWPESGGRTVIAGIEWWSDAAGEERARPVQARPRGPAAVPGRSGARAADLPRVSRPVCGRAPPRRAISSSTDPAATARRRCSPGCTSRPCARGGRRGPLDAGGRSHRGEARPAPAVADVVAAAAARRGLHLRRPMASGAVPGRALAGRGPGCPHREEAAAAVAGRSPYAGCRRRPCAAERQPDRGPEAAVPAGAGRHPAPGVAPERDGRVVLEPFGAPAHRPPGRGARRRPMRYGCQSWRRRERGHRRRCAGAARGRQPGLSVLRAVVGRGAVAAGGRGWVVGRP